MQPVDRPTISQFFYDSLALSAWKAIQESRWSLRVNPSSGNLHPTEGYLISGAIPGLFDGPCICHYAPFEHGLEIRRPLTKDIWSSLTSELPPGVFFVALASIHWRESWKYGERAYRYCQHDAGHAIAALNIAAGVLGWSCRLVESVTDNQLSALLGLDAQEGIEAEHPDCLLVIAPAASGPELVVPAAWPNPLLIEVAAAQPVLGEPNRLSADHHDWPIIDEVARAASKREGTSAPHRAEPAPHWSMASREISARRIIRQRRSAVALDGRTSIARDTFYTILLRTMPFAANPCFAAWPWPPSVHLALFVHRVEGLPRGLYLLARNAQRVDWIKEHAKNSFAWKKPDACPGTFPLFLLHEADYGSTANHVSCHQEIAEDGAFAVAMLAEFEPRIREFGPWFYRRLFWETGIIGQLLYLEAEAAGVRGTGIGCFFDDATHEVLGIRERSLQSLYHFTIGGPLEDRRLQTLPAYFHRKTDATPQAS
jgi:SagB-type dehydrogenase family enzyme